MRSSIAVFAVLAACAPEPVAVCEALVLPSLVDRRDLEGTFRHHAAVIASSDPSRVGDERTSEGIAFAITEDHLIGLAEDGGIALMLRIETHVDVLEGTLRETGEPCTRILDLGRAPEDRSHLRFDASTNVWIDPDHVPVPAGAEPVAYHELAPARTSVPVRTERGGIEWTLVTSYAHDGVAFDVFHTLTRESHERIELRPGRPGARSRR